MGNPAARFIKHNNVECRRGDERRARATLSRPEEGIQLPVVEHRREVGMVDAQVADNVRLLVVLHRAMRTLESRRLLALVPQMRQH